ncbi:hypothetical protein KJ980_06190 [Patescibacteria group bacterium]|nr:hypothetical protein [Patescibacteria group bacterium]MBU4099210.1 hypothetical protein [Patescibacteria group bacterium]
MFLKIKQEHRTFLRVLITYGMHIWVIIFVCNVVIFYSIRFFINASTTRTADVNTPVEITVSPPVATEIPTPVPTAAGPVINLSFSLPGIGTNGGNLMPSHVERDVTVHLYNSDANISDKVVKPAYTIKTQAVYDSDPNSSTYTYFVNKYVDLGAIANGNYQISIQTPQSLRQLMKLSDSRDPGGQLFDLSDKRFTTLPPQKMITGDVYPSPNGDNIMDINDYNLLVNCYNIQISSSKCANAAPADLDDNGVSDGIDYNIMLSNFRTLLSLGYSVPTIPVPPSDIPIKISPSTPGNTTPTAPKISQAPIKPPSNGAFGTIFIFILIVITIGSIAFAVFKFHLLNIFLPKKSETEKAIQSPAAEESVDKTNSSEIIEKTYYLKKVSVDTQKNGVWVTLADDAGITTGFYPKTDISDGFVKIKGTLRNDQEYKQYIYITELETED